MIYINDEKLKRFNLDYDNFCVLMDFDKTMTCGSSSGSWGVFENTNYIESGFIKDSTDLVNQYYPYEIDYSLDNDTKSKYLNEWYYKNMDLLYNYNLTESALLNCINESPIQFRKGCIHFLHLLYKRNIPVVILSAGIGNVIVEALKKEHCLFPNIYILSNFIGFKNNKMLPFTSPIIHTSNKSIDKLPITFLNKIRAKENILLFGDLIEDLYMVKKEELNRTLSFGFFNNFDDDKLDHYLDNYDIVITNNASFESIFDVLDRDFNINLKDSIDI